MTVSWVPCLRGRNQGSCIRATDDTDGSSAHPNASVLGSVSSKPVLGCLKLSHLYPSKRERTERVMLIDLLRVSIPSTHPELKITSCLQAALLSLALRQPSVGYVPSGTCELTATAQYPEY